MRGLTAHVEQTGYGFRSLGSPLHRAITGRMGYDVGTPTLLLPAKAAPVEARPAVTSQPLLSPAEHLLRFQARQDARQEHDRRNENRPKKFADRTPERRAYEQAYYRANRTRIAARVQAYRADGKARQWWRDYYRTTLRPALTARQESCKAAGHVIPPCLGRPAKLCPACRLTSRRKP